MESPIADRVRETFPEAITARHAFRGDETVVLRPETLVAVATWLRDDAATDFDFLMDLTAVDFPDRDPRFEVVYHLYSLSRNHRLRLKVPVDEREPKVDTLTGIYAAADWFEREVFDMFGIRFRGHPNLRRILMYEGFEGHPLRKDYPLRRRQPIRDLPRKWRPGR